MTRQFDPWTPQTRRQRCLVYVYTMFGSACFFIGITSTFGSSLQILFLGSSLALLIKSRAIAVSIRS